MKLTVASRGGVPLVVRTGLTDWLSATVSSALWGYEGGKDGGSGEGMGVVMGRRVIRRQEEGQGRPYYDYNTNSNNN